MKRKITALCLVVALLAVAVVGGTMAYFTDTESATNTFTVGSVEIALHEDNASTDPSTFKRDGDYRTWLTEQTMMPGKLIEKDVYVENTGKNDAYVRVKISVPANVELKWENDGWTLSNTTTTSGSYTVYTATYNTALAPGKTTGDSLTGIMLSPSVKDPNEIATYDVLVNAEAIQVDGFADMAAAFAALDAEIGSSTGATAPSTTAMVSTAAELKNALSNRTITTIILTDDIDMSAEPWTPVEVWQTLTLNGNGKSIKNMTIKGAVDANGFKCAALISCSRSDITIQNLTIDGAVIDSGIADDAVSAVYENYLAAGFIADTGYETTTTLSNCSLINSKITNYDRTGGMIAYGGWEKSSYVMNNVSVKNTTLDSFGTAGALVAYNNGTSNITVNGGEISKVAVSSSEGANKAGLLMGTVQGATTKANITITIGDGNTPANHVGRLSSTVATNIVVNGSTATLYTAS